MTDGENQGAYAFTLLQTTTPTHKKQKLMIITKDYKVEVGKSKIKGERDVLPLLYSLLVIVKTVEKEFLLPVGYYKRFGMEKLCASTPSTWKTFSNHAFHFVVNVRSRSFELLSSFPGTI